MTTKSTTDNGPRTTDKPNWRLFAAAGAAALAATSAAEASIITGSLNKAVYYNDATVSIGNARETVIANRTGSVARDTTHGVLQGQLKLFVTGQNTARNFYKGVPIAGSHTNSKGVLQSHFFQFTATSFLNVLNSGSRGRFSNQVGYVGFKLPNGDLGWLSAEVTDYGAEVDLLNYAYNDATGGAINAGQTAAVPEPTALGLLAMGSAGVLAWRRRRMVVPTPQ